MANVIDFQNLKTRAAHQPRSAPHAGSAQVMLFTGVRYERWVEAVPSARSRQQGRRKSADNSAQD